MLVLRASLTSARAFRSLKAFSPNKARRAKTRKPAGMNNGLVHRCFIIKEFYHFSVFIVYLLLLLTSFPDLIAARAFSAHSRTSSCESFMALFSAATAALADGPTWARA